MDGLRIKGEYGRDNTRNDWRYYFPLWSPIQVVCKSSTVYRRIHLDLNLKYNLIWLDLERNLSNSSPLNSILPPPSSLVCHNFPDLFGPE